jgi:RES domain-containing protein
MAKLSGQFANNSAFDEANSQSLAAVGRTFLLGQENGLHDHPLHFFNAGGRFWHNVRMARFETPTDFWSFEHSVKRVSRHILESSSQRFLDALLETSATRLLNFKAHAVFWRSQLGHDFRVEKEIDDVLPTAYSPERMMPLPDRAKEGRVNPKGIPCLYLSTDKETAMSEVRPWIGSLISLAQFTLLKDIQIVDFSADGTPQFIDKDSDPVVVEKENWAWVNEAFSKPVTPTDDTADYAPTQIIAEAFRVRHYDGIAYGSSLGSGKNFALFNPAVADLINCTLYTTQSVEFQFQQTDNTYYVTKHYPELAQKLPKAETAVLKIVGFEPVDNQTKES